MARLTLACPQCQGGNEKSSRQALQKAESPEVQGWAKGPVCPGLRTGLHLIPKPLGKFPSLSQTQKAHCLPPLIESRHHDVPLNSRTDSLLLFKLLQYHKDHSYRLGGPNAMTMHYLPNK